MDHLGVVGLSYRHGGAATVARYSIAPEHLAARLPELRARLGVAELVYVATCNRVELWYAHDRAIAAEDLRPAVHAALDGESFGGDATRPPLRAWLGEAATEHVLLVTSGLDSAQAGEREIATQVRRAWHRARDAGTTGPTLDRLCAEALRVSRRAHRVALRPAVGSLADLTTGRVLGQLSKQSGAVALVGVSPMTRRCGKALSAQGVSLVVVNRGLAAAEVLAAELGATCSPLDAFRSEPPPVSAVVLATGAQEPVLDAEALAALVRASAGAPLIVDLGVPANVDPEVALACGIERVGIDELVEEARRERSSHLLELAPARALIDERLQQLRGEAAVRAVGRDVAELREAFERIALADLERLLGRGDAAFDPAREALLRDFTLRLARRLAHLPLRGIRALAAEADPGTVSRFFSEARLHRVPPAPHSSTPTAPDRPHEEDR